MKILYSGQTVVLSALFACVPVFAGGAPIQAKGISNFHQVNDHIYRGAQPQAEGWQTLSKMGVKVVIDLRRDHEEGHSVAAEQKAVEAAGMRYVNLPMNGIVAPPDEYVRKAMELMNGQDPVFVHCKLGKDRTGTVIACYRISHDRWQNRQALDEAKSIGLHRIEFGMKRYITSYSVTE